MKKLSALFLAVYLSGCSTLTTSLGNKEAFAACKAADVVTTGMAIRHGAIEGNPVIRAVLHMAGIGGFAVLSGALVYFVWQHEQAIDQRFLAGASGVTCVAAISNGALLR